MILQVESNTLEDAEEGAASSLFVSFCPFTASFHRAHILLQQYLSLTARKNGVIAMHVLEYTPMSVEILIKGKKDVARLLELIGGDFTHATISS